MGTHGHSGSLGYSHHSAHAPLPLSPANTMHTGHGVVPWCYCSALVAPDSLQPPRDPPCSLRLPRGPSPPCTSLGTPVTLYRQRSQHDISICLSTSHVHARASLHATTASQSHSTESARNMLSAPISAHHTCMCKHHCQPITQHGERSHNCLSVSIRAYHPPCQHHCMDPPAILVWLTFMCAEPSAMRPRPTTDHEPDDDPQPSAPRYHSSPGTPPQSRYQAASVPQAQQAPQSKFSIPASEQPGPSPQALPLLQPRAQRSARPQPQNSAPGMNSSSTPPTLQPRLQRSAGSQPQILDPNPKSAPSPSLLQPRLQRSAGFQPQTPDLSSDLSSAPASNSIPPPQLRMQRRPDQPRASTNSPQQPAANSPLPPQSRCDRVVTA